MEHFIKSIPGKETTRVNLMNSPEDNQKRFVYIYFNRNHPAKIRQVVPSHVGYWKAASLSDYLGGPFGDRTGGLISFSATNLQEATEIIQKDPFFLADLIDQMWIKEWLTE